MRAIEELVRLRPPLGLQWQAVARLAASVGELTLSREAIAQFTENAGHSPAAQYQAAALLSRRSPDGEMAVSMAKLHAAAAAQSVAAEILQLHGGFGQMEESPVPRYYRDVAGFSVGAGTSEIMREIISRTLVRQMEG